MLYKKNNSKNLDLTLFKNPTSEYRATPFWAWNCELEQKELEWQTYEFDKTVPAIFTDELQFPGKTTLKYATEKKDVTIAWTDDLPETFTKAYEGEDLLANIPELIWERADRVPSVIRYHYHDHVCERFVQAFADNCGAWCKEHGIELTGHVMEEPTLKSQTQSLGEAIRNYRGYLWAVRQSVIIQLRFIINHLGGRSIP